MCAGRLPRMYLDSSGPIQRATGQRADEGDSEAAGKWLMSAHGSRRAFHSTVDD